MRSYRGLTKESKWVYGWYFHGSSNDTHWIQLLDETMGNPVVAVIPETVGQATGLKDKKRTKEFPKGQEIYEGDIVEINGQIYVCEFNTTPYGSQFRFWILPHKKWSDGSRREKKVIGNIHTEAE